MPGEYRIKWSADQSNESIKSPPTSLDVFITEWTIEEFVDLSSEFTESTMNAVAVGDGERVSSFMVTVDESGEKLGSNMEESGASNERKGE